MNGHKNFVDPDGEFEIYDPVKASPLKGYWVGPYGCLVSLEIYDVPAEDGINIFKQDGVWTEMSGIGFKIPTREEWLKEHTTLVRTKLGWTNMYMFNYTPEEKKKDSPSFISEH